MVRLFPGVKQHSLAYPLFSDCFKSQDRRFRLSPSPYVSPHCFASPCLSGTRLGFWLLVLVLVCLWAKGLPWQCSMWNGPGDGGRDGSPLARCLLHWTGAVAVAVDGAAVGGVSRWLMV